MPPRVRRSARPSAGVLLRATRPRQWSKNVLVVAAPCAAGVILRPEVAWRVAVAFVAFCLLASVTYLLALTAIWAALFLSGVYAGR